MKYTLLLIVIFIGGICSSCQDQVNDKTDHHGTANGTFSIEITDNTATTNNESTIQQIDLLFFKGNDNSAVLIDHYTSIDNKDSQKVTLNISRNMPNDATMVMAIANAHDIVVNAIDNSTSTTTYGDFITKLTIDSKQTAWDLNTEYVPMWARATGITVQEGMKPVQLALLRMLAKINVSIATGNKFALKHVYLYNAQDGGRIAPDINGTDTLITVSGSTLTTPLSYEADAATNTCSDKIYTFEANANTQSKDKTPYLVIGGSYNNGGESFYRLDFANDNTKLPLKRNNRYNVTVTTISKEGRSSADEAGKHPEDQNSVDYSVTVGGDTEDKIRVTATDGKYILGLSTDTLFMSADSYTTTDLCMANRVWIQSNNPNVTWTINKITDDAGKENPDWIGCDTKKGDKTNITPVRFSLKENTGADRMTTVWVTAGNISYGLKVKQSAQHQTGLVLQLLKPDGTLDRTLQGGEIFRFNENGDVKAGPGYKNVTANQQIITLKAIWYPNNQACEISHESQLVAFDFGGKNTDQIQFAHLDTLDQSPTTNGVYQFNVACDTVFDMEALKKHPHTSFINFTAHNEQTGQSQSHGVFFIQEPTNLPSKSCFTKPKRYMPLQR